MISKLYHNYNNIFLLFISSISAFLIFISKIGMNNDADLILRSLGLSYLLILFPFYILKIFFYKKKFYFFNESILTLFLLIFFILSGIFNNVIGINLSYLYAICGFVLFFIYLFNKSTLKFCHKKNIIFILITIIFSVLVTTAYYSNHYNHPLMIEKIINGSWAHRDILYLSSIAGMLKTYFYVGTGLDGFVPHYYHFFSHYIIAMLSSLLKTHTLEFYSTIYPIIIIPLFFNFFIYATLGISNFFSKINKFERIFQNNNFFWILIFIFFAIPFPVDYNFLPEKYHYLYSHTYTFSLIFLFIIINIFFTGLEYIKLNKKDHFYYLIPFFIFILSICCSLSKISFFYVLTISIFFVFFRLNLYRYFYFNLLFIFWILFGLLIYFNLILYFDGQDIFNEEIVNIPNYSIKDNIVFSFFSIFFIFLKLFALKIKNFKIFIDYLRKNKILDIEVLFLIMIALYIVPYQYFKGIQVFLSFIFIIANFNLFFNFLFNKENI